MLRRCLPIPQDGETASLVREDLLLLLQRTSCK